MLTNGPPADASAFDGALAYVAEHASILAEQVCPGDVVFAYAPADGARRLAVIGASYVATAAELSALPDAMRAAITADAGKGAAWVVCFVDEGVAYFRMTLRVQPIRVTRVAPVAAGGADAS